jgi:hypothetical protein
MARRHEMTDAPWEVVKDLSPGKASDPGRTAVVSRQFVNTVLFVLKTTTRPSTEYNGRRHWYLNRCTYLFPSSPTQLPCRRAKSENVRFSTQTVGWLTSMGIRWWISAKNSSHKSKRQKAVDSTRLTLPDAHLRRLLSLEVSVSQQLRLLPVEVDSSIEQECDR